jgi:hypothetical protein
VEATKTTFYLSNVLRARLKGLAARKGVSVTELLTEGAALVIARHQGTVDREELARRAALARERLRGGLYSGPSLSSSIDEVVYETAKAGSTRRAKR